MDTSVISRTFCHADCMTELLHLHQQNVENMTKLEQNAIERARLLTSLFYAATFLSNYQDDRITNLPSLQRRIALHLHQQNVENMTKLEQNGIERARLLTSLFYAATFLSNYQVDRITNLQGLQRRIAETEIQLHANEIEHIHLQGWIEIFPTKLEIALLPILADEQLRRDHCQIYERLREMYRNKRNRSHEVEELLRHDTRAGRTVRVQGLIWDILGRVDLKFWTKLLDVFLIALVAILTFSVVLFVFTASFAFVTGINFDNLRMAAACVLLAAVLVYVFLADVVKAFLTLTGMELGIGD